MSRKMPRANKHKISPYMGLFTHTDGEDSEVIVIVKTGAWVVVRGASLLGFNLVGDINTTLPVSFIGISDVLALNELSRVISWKPDSVIGVAV